MVAQNQTLLGHLTSAKQKLLLELAEEPEAKWAINRIWNGRDFKTPVGNYSEAVSVTLD